MQMMVNFLNRRKIILINLMTNVVMVSDYFNENEYRFMLQLENPQAGSRPSEYLRDRCPLCFGGVNWQQPEEMLD